MEKTNDARKRTLARYGLGILLLTFVALNNQAASPMNPEGLPEDILDALPAQPKPITLIGPGVEPPVIVVGKEASESERYAAEELAWHLGQITSQNIGIVEDDKVPEGARTIAVGKSRLTADYDIGSLGVEQYLIDVKPDGLVIVGGRKDPVTDSNGTVHARDRGTLYGVYDVLETLGTRWYRPEPWGWHIPKVETVQLPQGMKTSAEPAFLGRAAVRMAARWAGQTPEHTAWTEQWAARQRLNVRTSPELKYGGEMLLGVNHAHSRIVPPAKYLKDHPEFFALIDGKRGNPGSGKLPQLCLGNPALQEVFAQNVTELAKNNPQDFSISVDPEDGTHLDRRMCQCELCLAMDDPKDPKLASNRVFAFTNIIAKKLAEAVPEANVGLYAYSMHTMPPTTVEKIEPNVVLAAANINSWTDWSKKLEDPNSPQNAQFVELIRNWKKILTHKPWVREYSAYGWMGPIPMYRILQDRVQTYRKLGVEGLLWPGEPNWGTQLLLIYLKAKLQWNPDLDLDRELDLFYQNYYGPAAVPMKRYHERWMQVFEESQIGSGLEGGISSGGRGLHVLCTPKLVAELEGDLSEARKLVENRAPYTQRLQGDEAGLEFVRRISEILSTKLASGLRKPNPRNPSVSYLESEEAGKQWEDFSRWLLEANKENLTFEVVDEKGMASSVALKYMVRDILANGRYATSDEKQILQDNGFSN